MAYLLFPTGVACYRRLILGTAEPIRGAQLLHFLGIGSTAALQRHEHGCYGADMKTVMYVRRVVASRLNGGVVGVKLYSPSLPASLTPG